MTGLVFVAGLFLGVLVGGFAVGLAAAAKRGDEQIARLRRSECNPTSP